MAHQSLSRRPGKQCVGGGDCSGNCSHPKPISAHQDYSRLSVAIVATASNYRYLRDCKGDKKKRRKRLRGDFKSVASADFATRACLISITCADSGAVVFGAAMYTYRCETVTLLCPAIRMMVNASAPASPS